MKLKILSWNVREVNDVSKRKVIKALIRSQKADMVCLQETKMQKMSIRVVRSLGVGRFLEWGVVNARGAAGGVVVFWDNRVLELVGMEVVWTRIFHVRPHSIGETRFLFICENLIF